MLKEFFKQAKNDEPVYITDVRDRLNKEGTLPFHLLVELYDKDKRLFPIMLPEVSSDEEKDFVKSYVNALIYNILSSLGAVKISIYLDKNNDYLNSLAKGLDETFQTALSKPERYGYGKCLNVNERVLNTLFKGEKEFSFEIADIETEPAVCEVKAMESKGSVFNVLPEKAKDKMLLGIDIGGTDIKLCASVNGDLCVYKEFDWFPAAFEYANQLIEPVILIVRLMRAGASLCAGGRSSEIDSAAFSKDASMEEMERGVSKMEAALAGDIKNFDAIGLSFPDVVIKNLIVGGETFKTRGMRENKHADYEKEFAKITVLCDLLKEFVTEEGAVMNTNDGPMAAFTAAVEMAAIGADVSKGFFAHTLGTELGTGWVRPDGSIPEIPLEVYNFIIDLGSFKQKEYDPNDVRSINNFNTKLAGTLQKYTCQSGVFRLAIKHLETESPAVYKEAFESGIFEKRGDMIVVPTEPKDMRKPALEFFMKKAGEGDEPCMEIFRKIGEYLAVTWQETEYIITPEAKDRSLFGRLVKTPACFNLMNEGAKRRVPDLDQYAADETLANTDLMKQLEAHPEYTVAQFAQAVGALFFGCMGLK